MTQGVKSKFEDVRDFLYLHWWVEKVKLKDLPQIMFEEHGFKACRRVYITELRRLGWSRNKRRSQGNQVFGPVVMEPLQGDHTTPTEEVNQPQSAGEAPDQTAGDTTTPGIEHDDDSLYSEGMFGESYPGSAVGMGSPDDELEDSLNPEARGTHEESGSSSAVDMGSPDDGLEITLCTGLGYDCLGPSYCLKCMQWLWDIENGPPAEMDVEFADRPELL